MIYHLILENVLYGAETRTREGDREKELNKLNVVGMDFWRRFNMEHEIKRIEMQRLVEL